MTIKLIVGLGNPGPQYSDTRHNAGAWFVERLCESHHLSLSPDSKIKALVGRSDLFGQDVRVCVPLSYMNLSGAPVSALANFYKIEPKEILVAYDELDLPAGTARLKFDGGSGGHNGIKDIMARLGTNQFYRLRIGIGRPANKEDVEHFVLKKPSKGEYQNMHKAIDKALEVLPDVLNGQINQAMTKLHTED